MKQITIPELVKICAENKNPVTRQAVHKAITQGLIPYGKKGDKKYLDLDNPAVQEYIHGTNRQREQRKPAPAKKKPAKKRTGKPAKTQTQAKLPAGKQGKPAAPSEKKSLYLKNLKGGRFYTGALRTAILERDNHTCVKCGKTPADGIRLEVDHIVEFEDGGETTYDNGQTLCAECNKGKASAKEITEDEFISMTEFGKRIGVHRNGVAEAIKNGTIEADRVTGKINYTTEVIKWFTGKRAPQGEGVENLEPYEMNRRAKFADMRKRELQVLVMEKKYLPIDFIDAVYIKHLENFHAIIERTASTYVQDIGKKILEAGEILPEHIEKFTALVLESMHNNKKQTRKFVNEYEPSL